MMLLILILKIKIILINRLIIFKINITKYYMKINKDNKGYNNNKFY